MNPRSSDRAVCEHTWQAPLSKPMLNRLTNETVTHIEHACTLMKGHAGEHRSSSGFTAPNGVKVTA